MDGYELTFLYIVYESAKAKSTIPSAFTATKNGCNSKSSFESVSSFSLNIFTTKSDISIDTVRYSQPGDEQKFKNRF